MRVDLPTCDLKKCRHYSDYNCTNEYAHENCEYMKLRKQVFENGYIVENGLLQHKKEYIFSIGEGKEIEDAITQQIAKLWNLFLKLEQTHPSDIEDFQHGIHEIQKVIGMRRLRRLFPEEYPSYIKKNGRWEITSK